MGDDTTDDRLYTLARLGYEAFRQAYNRHGEDVLAWVEQGDTDRMAWLAATATIAGVLMRAQEIERGEA